jgi:ketosteroid isomerase-like protein
MNSRILELEERLRLAMCHSDVNALDNLLAENLIFTNHLGQVVSKSEDINSHRKRTFVINSVSLSNQEVIHLGNSAVVTTQANISGSYNGQPSEGKFRFTRVWSNNTNGWQVVAGHSCIIA